MFPGVDFYINTSEGIITFLRTVPPESRIITAFHLENLVTGDTVSYGNIYDMFPDQDGDGLILEDPGGGFDVDDDGLIDEDGFSGVDGLPGVDNDGDGQINEDPGSDWIDDGIYNPDDDGDGLIDEDCFRNSFKFIKMQYNRYTGHALMNYYTFGAKNLMQEGFIVKIYNEFDSDSDKYTYSFKTSKKKISYLTIFGLDRTGREGKPDGQIDNDRVDFDEGIIKFPDPTPFDLTDNPPEYWNGMGLTADEINELINSEEVNNQEIYPTSSKYSSNPRSKYRIEITYQSDVKVFNLGINLVEGSEEVKINGVVASRNIDYYIDYEFGILTFINAEKIKGNAQIEIKYEYQPIISFDQKYIYGGRLEWNNKKQWLFLGSTILEEKFIKRRDNIPRPEEAPRKNTVYDIDSKIILDQVKISDSIEIIPGIHTADIPLNITLETELAKSIQNPNIFGKAQIDTFEGTKEEILLPADERSWAPASLPAGVTNDSRTQFITTYKRIADDPLFENSANQFRWWKIDEPSGQGRPEELLPDETLVPQKQSLVIENLNPYGWGGIQYAFSTNLVDFTNKTYFEFWIKALDLPGQTGPSNAIIHIDIGLISEDSDGDGILDTEDVGKDGIPNSGDYGENDGRLNEGEDIGFAFRKPASWTYTGQVRIGKDNKHLDTEDLDKDGTLDTQNRYYSYSYDPADPFLKNLIINFEENAGWKLIHIPFNFDTAKVEGTPNPTAIKYVRIWVENTGKQSFFKIEDFAFVGNKWEKGVVENGSAVDYLNVRSISINDPEVNIYFNDSVRSNEYDQEALALDYGITGNTDMNRIAYTEETFYKALDLRDYEFITFKVFGRKINNSKTGKTQVVFFRFGLNEMNYYQKQFKVSKGYSPSDWKDIQISLEPWELDKLVKVGTPTIDNIRYLAFVINVSTGQETTGEIWINEMIVDKVKKREGYAKRFGVITSYNQYLNINAETREVNQNYASLGSSRTGNLQKADSINMSLTRLQWLPLQYSFNKTSTELMDILDISQLENAIGISESSSHNFSTSFSYLTKFWSGLPTLSYNYTYNQAESFTGLGKDIFRSGTYSTGQTAALRFNLPFKMFTTFNIGGGYNETESKYNRDYDINAKDKINSRLNGNTDANFVFGKYLTLRPAFNFTKSYEDEYLLSLQQNLNISTSWVLYFQWLRPRVDFNGSYFETYSIANYYNLEPEEKVPFNAKSTNTISSSINFGIFEIFPKLKFLKLETVALSFSYSINKNIDFSDLRLKFSDIEKWNIFQDVESIKLPEDGGMIKSNSETNRYSINLNYRPLNFLSTSFSYSESHTESNTTGTYGYIDEYSTNTGFNFDYIEKILKFLRNSSFRLSLGTLYRDNNEIITESLTPAFSWPMNFSERFVHTLSGNYGQTTTTKLLETDTDYNLGFNSDWSYNLDLSYGIKFPFVKNVWKVQNFLNIKWGANYSQFRTTYKGKTEYDRYTGNFGLGYNFTNKMTMDANFSYSSEINKTEPTKNVNITTFTIKGVIIF